MNEFFSKLSKQLTDFWNRFDKKQKLKLATVAVIVVIALSIAVFIVTRPSMVTLYSGLSVEQAADMKDLLDELQIKNTTANEGTTIKVDSKRLVDARYALAQENIPSPGFTFEDALTNDMSTTQEEKKAKLKYAKERELERQLENIEGVEQATVNLVIPDFDRLIFENERESTAGVNIKTSSKLSKSQILGIARFVAYSVDNLDPKNVRIIDQNGDELYSGSEDDSTVDNLDKKYEIENTIKKQKIEEVQDLLSPIYDDVQVTANIIMDFDAYSETKETYSSPIEGGSKGIPSSEYEYEASGSDISSGEAPGIDSNGGDITNYPTQPTTGTDSKTSTYQADYNVNKTVSEANKSVGDVLYDESSLSVVVFRNKVYDQTQLEDSGTLEDVTWEQYKDSIELNQPISIGEDLVTLVQNGTGIPAVNIIGYEKPIFVDKKSTLKPIENYIPIILIVVVLILLAYVIYKGTAPVEITEIEPELSVEEMLSKTEQEVQEIRDGEGSEVKNQIEKFIDEKPEAAAQLLRNWLDEWE